MPTKFNICGSASVCADGFSGADGPSCASFQPLKAYHAWKFEKKISQLFGEDLSRRSVLQDINDNYVNLDNLTTSLFEKKAREFLESQIAPVLLTALMQMQELKPKNRVEWLADWLTLHDPANKLHHDENHSRKALLDHQVQQY
ncbi:uncharacterized protein LOC132202824 [Neocloeon triangulifer]|uniref:uncharacterized protein LOC132202824 n=1 Tax=Neocloeon triangulifer TaxID=2078957 RepID=UPI00286F1347|nr:uncharacterized protein LOC132202824 [Neocloeon triangulifer]